MSDPASALPAPEPPDAAGADDVVLLMEHITKDYPGVRALDDVTFDLRRGEVHALVGENGAGKSTLMKVLAGAEQAGSGGVLLNGRPVHIRTPQDAIEAGISIIYQEFNLVPYLSVAENIYLGRQPTLAGVFVDWRQMHDGARELLDRLGASFSTRALVHTLAVAEQQMVEIAKALSLDAQVLVMDEPSSTLTEHELQALFEQIRTLKGHGVSIVYISHRLEEVIEIADRVTVLRDGRLIDTRAVAELDRAEIVRMMVGRELADVSFVSDREPGEELLRVEGFTRGDAVRDISFSLRRGEVLGIAGLVGAGRTELVRAIFGADRIDSGSLYLEGKPVRINSPAQAIRHGIGFVTEDRKLQGLILGMALQENVSLANLQAVSVAGFLSRARERRAAESYVGELDIRTPSTTQMVRNLSGGNQQKVVLAKWLFTQSKVLIFDEPTRGIDVGSKAEIHQIMRRVADGGAGVIMISSELPEILQMSDRILVMHDGRIAGELSREEATQEKIMFLATGEDG